jgi:hypothetical protein
MGINFTHRVAVVEGRLNAVLTKADRWLTANDFRIEDMERPGELTCRKGSQWGLSDQATIRCLHLKLASAGDETFVSVVARVGEMGVVRGHMFGDVISQEVEALFEALGAPQGVAS